MLLAADIGNTNITLGVFDDCNLCKTFRIASDVSVNQKYYEEQLSILNSYKIDSCVIVSVVKELNTLFSSACSNVFKLTPLLVSSDIFDMKLKVKEPQAVGADRLVNAYAAMNCYNLPAIVVDIGTAVTFDIVSRDKAFLGGVIMPGINLQFKSLNEYTSKLPLVEADISQSAIGDCTQDAILSGVIRGTAASIEGLIKQCEKELGERAVVIATGGQCELILGYLERKFDFVEPNLTLKGLKKLYSALHVNLY